MQEVYDISWKNNQNSVVAMGYFDGVHTGHKFLIDQMKNYAQENGFAKAVFTFTKSITLGHKGKDILTIKQKLEIMQNMDIDLFYSPDFSVFSSLTPQEFVEKVLIKSMGAKAVFCGENFLFGKNRAGTIEFLKEICAKNNVKVFVVPTITIENETVSSSLIRNLLAQGDIEKANIMLGRPYSIDFEVIHGKNIGEKMGTPTINQIFPNSMCSPKEGVYITKTTVNDKIYPSATGFGSRPTVNGLNQSCETYICGFKGDLYAQNVKVEFFKYLYKPQKFENLNQLKDMILSAADESEKYYSDTAKN